jgi:hypothetical protein
MSTRVRTPSIRHLARPSESETISSVLYATIQVSAYLGEGTCQRENVETVSSRLRPDQQTRERMIALEWDQTSPMI